MNKNELKIKEKKALIKSRKKEEIKKLTKRNG